MVNRITDARALIRVKGVHSSLGSPWIKYGTVAMLNYSTGTSTTNNIQSDLDQFKNSPLSIY